MRPIVLATQTVRQPTVHDNGPAAHARRCPWARETPLSEDRTEREPGPCSLRLWLCLELTVPYPCPPKEGRARGGWSVDLVARLCSPRMSLPSIRLVHALDLIFRTHSGDPTGAEKAADRFCGFVLIAAPTGTRDPLIASVRCRSTDRCGRDGGGSHVRERPERDDEDRAHHQTVHSGFLCCGKPESLTQTQPGGLQPGATSAMPRFPKDQPRRPEPLGRCHSSPERGAIMHRLRELVKEKMLPDAVW